MRRLALQADVLIENFKVGGLARYGSHLTELRPLNPATDLLSISAFGQDGPRGAEPGYDAMIQAHGRAHERHGRPGRRARGRDRRKSASRSPT